MKKTIFCFAALLYSFSSWAQHPDLQENIWYVDSFELNGTLYESPFNTELRFASAEFFGPFYRSDVCQSGFLVDVEYTGTDIFHIPTFTAGTIPCNLSENETFRLNYFTYFENGNNNPYQYSITEDSQGIKTLSIINGIGDQLIYLSRVYDLMPPELATIPLYLNELLIDGTYISIPSNSEIPFVELTNNGLNNFRSDLCLTLTFNGFFNTSTNSFYTGQLGSVFPFCVDEDNLAFHITFAQFFINTDNDLYPFSYEIIENPDESISWIINKTNGDRAVFGDELVLNSQEISQSNSYLFPNPVKDSFTLTSQKNISIKNIGIYDSVGNNIEVLDQVTPQMLINISSYASGLYFLKIEDNYGNKVIKKLIKQ